MLKLNFKQKEAIVNGYYFMLNMDIQKDYFTHNCWMAFVYPTFAKREEGIKAVIATGLIIDENSDGAFTMTMRAKSPKMSYTSFVEKAFTYYEKGFSEEELINMINIAIMQKGIFT